MTTRFRVLGGLCVSLLAAVCVFRVSAQTPPVGAFRAAANAVVLDVSVTDDRNRPMLGLTARDFTITEDGKERPVVAFDAVNVTSQSSTPASWPAADVVTNEDPLDGRVMAIVMDDATPMPVAEGPRAKDAARALVDRMGPKDLAAVVFPAAQQSTQDFTRDRARLRAAIDRFQPRVDLGSTDRRIGDDRGAPNNFTHFDPTASTLYLRYLKTLRSLVDALGARALGRKSLVLISVGLPIEIRTNTSAFAAAVNEGEDPEFAISAVDSLPDPSEQKDLVFREVMNTIRAAMTSSVRVYGIDPGGARTPLSAAGADEFNAGLGNKVFLEGVSRATGGFAITSTNDVHAAGAQILADTGTYYLLGYQSTKRGAVKVRVNRPGAAVSIRPPVVRDGRPPDLSTALNSLVPLGGLAMQMTAAPFAIPGGAQAALAVVVGFRQDGPATGSQIIETVQVVVSVYDTSGKSVASKTSNVTAGLPTGGMNVRFEVLTRLDLKPGRYRVRAAAQTSFDRAIGGVSTDVDVPDFGKAGFALSGLMMSAEPGRLATPRDALKQVLSIVPTAQREFDRSQTIMSLVTIYPAAGRPATDVDVLAEVRDLSDRVAFGSRESIAAAEFGASRHREFTVRIPSGSLPPGSYLMTIDAAPRGVNDPRGHARTSVPFTVR